MAETERTVSAERVIRATPHAIFDILADPAQHSRFDGSDTVKSARGNPERLSLGARFSMDMRMGLAYRITNTVVEFDEGRVIAWQHFARNVWRYELEALDDGTRVRETFDWSNGRGRKLIELMGYPEKNRTNMEATLERLAYLVEDAPT
jgi:uncharacterized protein YndB with AHSA1/START domain